MILAFFPVKKLRRNGKCLVFGTILLVGAVAVYHQMLAAKSWRGDSSMSPDSDGSSWKRDVLDEKAKRNHQPDYMMDSAAWRSSYTLQTWKPEYKGQANLHVFEDWCGSSTDDLRKNQHYPLYPHNRTTVRKLAVSPQWTNYGLRIFGYLHPYTDGEFMFALSSDDNSELWLSTDDSPVNLQLLAWVGKTGREWAAPGEFEKYPSQISRPVWLSAEGRYFFEVIHKQNDKGTDHVEVAWKPLDQGFEFMLIESKHISLYVNESALLMSDVAHIPQTVASHQRTTTKQDSVTADLLREEPRDTIYRVPLINRKFLHGVLPDCSYQPTYTIKGFPLLRYQGLQFVHLSYVYPNDYTRLTHMESENSCFYPESPYYMKMFGFSRYMKLDRPELLGKANLQREFGINRRKSFLEEEDDFDNEANEREKEARPDQIDNALFPDYGDDYDDYVQRRRRQLFSIVQQETNIRLNSSDTRLHTDQLKEQQWKDREPQYQPEPKKPAEPQESVQRATVKTQLIQDGTFNKTKQIKAKRKRSAKKQKVKLVETDLSQNGPKSISEVEAVGMSKQLTSKHSRKRRSRKIGAKQTFKMLNDSNPQPLDMEALYEKPSVATKRRFLTNQSEIHPQHTAPQNDSDPSLNGSETHTRKHLGDEEVEINMSLQDDLENSINRAKMIERVKVSSNWSDTQVEDDKAYNRADNRRNNREGDRDAVWGVEDNFEGVNDEDLTPAPVFDTEVNWSQTFQLKHMDLQSLRSDWIDLRCNISGNLVLHSSDVLPMVKTFMDQLNEKHHGRFTLVRVVNVVKRVDGIQGSRYLLELELKDVNGQLLRLSQYIYALIRHSRQRSRDLGFQQSKAEMLLCNPVGLHWNPLATVHFIVPVKNQARWVLQLIADMENLFRITGDTNFNLIIADYHSTDMDVRKALQKSSLPRYEYVKLGGNFERSAGLQAGINLINDEHSILFLCDLHIHFPPSIIDTIRKHCVEGYMAFAPIVMRLDCGATPLDARGYWEVNGFGLLGIYKSDLDAVGGMNTKEFTDRWGGEDWELLDRILQAGLEVERIYLRNFFHYYHSKRGMWNRRMSANHR